VVVLKSPTTNIHQNQKNMLDREDSHNYDTVVESVVNRLRDRAKAGFEKYGTDLDRTDLTTEQWMEHAIEEALDFSLYLTKLKQNFKKSI
jgi:histidinol dehydrogenase